jgi:hypothetical protein
MKESYHFDLHGGLKTQRMDDITHRMDIAPQRLCVKGMEEISFGGILTTFEDDIISLCTWTFSFGGPRTSLSKTLTSFRG